MKKIIITIILLSIVSIVSTAESYDQYKMLYCNSLTGEVKLYQWDENFERTERSLGYFTCTNVKNLDYENSDTVEIEMQPLIDEIKFMEKVLVVVVVLLALFSGILVANL